MHNIFYLYPQIIIYLFTVFSPNMLSSNVYKAIVQIFIRVYLVL